MEYFSAHRPEKHTFHSNIKGLFWVSGGYYAEQVGVL
jgi:hypothetical protein